MVRAGRIPALSFAVVAAAVVGDARPAGAECDRGDRFHEVNTWRGDHLLNGRGWATNVSGGYERWCDLRTSETSGNPAGYHVCDYQGAIYVYNSDGSYTNRSNTSSYHDGCSWQGWFFHDALDSSSFRENSHFRTKWRSDVTDQEWKEIGELVD